LAKILLTMKMWTTLCYCKQLVNLVFVTCYCKIYLHTDFRDIGHRIVVYLYQQHDGGFYSAFEVDTIEVPRSILELPGFIMKLGDIKRLINLYELFCATKKDKTSFSKCKIPSPNIYEMNKIINTRKPKKIKTSLEF